MPYGQPKVNEKGKESLRELPHEIIDFDTGQYEAGRTKKTTGLVASNGELGVQYSAHSSVAPFACDMMAPTGCLGISRSVRFE